jgi:hypothetical protein
VQHRQIDSSFDIKLLVTFLEYGAQRIGNTAFLPEPRADQVRPDPTNCHRFDISSRVGVGDGKTLAMTQTRAHQGFQLSASFQEVQSSQGGDRLLADLFSLAHAMHDLEATIGTGSLITKKTWSLIASTASNHRSWIN